MPDDSTDVYRAMMQAALDTNNASLREIERLHDRIESLIAELRRYTAMKVEYNAHDRDGQASPRTML